MSERIEVTISDEMSRALRKTAKDELNERAKLQQEWLGEEKAELSQTSGIDTKTAVRFAIEEQAKKQVRSGK